MQCMIYVDVRLNGFGGTKAEIPISVSVARELISNPGFNLVSTDNQLARYIRYAA
jgi:hypothetical protein